MSNWSYSDASSCRTGTMQCTACGKPIETGEYRYRQKSVGMDDFKYVNQHRACTESDQRWAQKDKAVSERHAYRLALSAACRAFRDKWEVNELDDYIIEEQA